jgi:hypothetical protein
MLLFVPSIGYLNTKRFEWQVTSRFETKKGYNMTYGKTEEPGGGRLGEKRRQGARKEIDEGATLGRDERINTQALGEGKEGKGQWIAA